MFTMPPTGEYWYRMVDPSGAPQGYARLQLEERAGGLDAAWELRIGWSGGSYEENRRIAFDPSWRMTIASMTVAGRESTSGHRQGDQWVWSSPEHEESRRPAPDRAVSGMGFLLALALPLQTGTTHEVFEIDESNACQDLGPATFSCAGIEELDLATGPLRTHRVELARTDGNVLPLWIDQDRRLVQVDWGGGNLMILSPVCTRDLFRPTPPAVTPEETGPDTLVVAGDFAAFSPAELWDHFTRPELLQRWWPQQAEIDLREQGAYVLSWPEGGGWVLRGQITALERPSRFGFSWAWEHDPPGTPPLTVTVELAPRPNGPGTRLRLTHGPYPAGESGARAREEHLGGWRVCLTRLRDQGAGS
jgi:uncharacterized protein YndB with AHSA1/START domain